jgi:GAF domain-containing protein
MDIPLKIRDKVVGVLSFQKDTDQPGGQSGALDARVSNAAWTADEIRLLERLVAQMGLALESARLYQDTQRRAAREQLVGEVTARMRETLDVDLVLRTAVQEIREALRLHDIAVRFHGEEVRS